jgi:hypothetical protein
MENVIGRVFAFVIEWEFPNRECISLRQDLGDTLNGRTVLNSTRVSYAASCREYVGPEAPTNL